MSSKPNVIRGVSLRIFRMFPGGTARAQHAILLFYMSVCVILICTFFLPYFASRGLTYGIYSCSLGLGTATLDLIILLAFRKVRLAGNFFCLSTMAFFLVSIYFTNGLESPYIPWLIMAPLTASLLFDNRGRVVWGVLMLLAYALIIAADRLGYLADTASYLQNRDEVALISGAVFFIYTLTLIYFAERARLERLRMARLIQSDHQRQKSDLLQVMEGRELERQRIARELHDGLNTHLTALRLQHQALLRDQGEDIPQAQAIAREMDNLATHVNNLSQRLSIHVLRDFGLEEAIRHLVGQSLDAGKCEVDAYLDQAEQVPGELQVPLYRILQRALSVLTELGQAKKIELQILVLPRMLRLMAEGSSRQPLSAPEKESMTNAMTDVQDYMNVLNGEVILEFDLQGNSSLIIEIPIPHEQDSTHPGR